MSKQASPQTSKVKAPKICLHRGTGQAYVTLSGHRHYLGKFDNPATHQRGHVLIAEWLSAGRRLRVEPEVITLTEVPAATTTL